MGVVHNIEEEVEMAQTLDDACKHVVEKVTGSVACGIVDLSNGELIGIHNVAQYTDEHNAVVAAATMDLFRGRNMVRTEQLVRKHRGVPEDGEHYMDEVFMTSKHLYHFAKVLSGNAVIMLVTRKTANMGLGWAQLKAAIPMVEPLVMRARQGQ